jgi:hypothetical protein
MSAILRAFGTKRDDDPMSPEIGMPIDDPLEMASSLGEVAAIEMRQPAARPPGGTRLKCSHWFRRREFLDLDLGRPPLGLPETVGLFDYASATYFSWLCRTIFPILST